MSDDTRASDADRDAVVEQLQEALQKGRLTMAELEERITKAYASKTWGELSALTRDLPGHLW